MLNYMLLALCAVLIQAISPIYPTSIESTTTLQAGTTHTIKWTYQNSNEPVQPFTIYLGQEENGLVVPYLPLSNVLDGSKMQHDWAIPKRKFRSGKNYCFVFKSANSKIPLVYSTWFDIKQKKWGGIFGLVKAARNIKAEQ